MQEARRSAFPLIFMNVAGSSAVLGLCPLDSSSFECSFETPSWFGIFMNRNLSLSVSHPAAFLKCKCHSFARNASPENLNSRGSAGVSR